MESHCRVLILEDDPIQRQLLESWLEMVPEVRCIGSVPTVKKALPLLYQERADILLLDIYLPDLDGLTLLRSLPRPPKVIVQSQTAERALEGFELGVTDYLMKPFAFDRFAKAMNRAVAEVRGGIATENAAVNASDHLIIRTNSGMQKVYFRDILYGEAMQNYTRVHLTNGEKPVALVSLKSFQQELSDAVFQRVHKSYVINLRHVDWLGTESVRLGEHTLPVGPTYREGLSEAWLRASLTGL